MYEEVIIVVLTFLLLEFGELPLPLLLLFIYYFNILFLKALLVFLAVAPAVFAAEDAQGQKYNAMADEEQREHQHHYGVLLYLRQ